MLTDGSGNQRSVRTDEPDLLSLSLNEGFDESELSLGDVESLMLSTTLFFLMGLMLIFLMDQLLIWLM